MNNRAIEQWNNDNDKNTSTTESKQKETKKLTVEYFGTDLTKLDAEDKEKLDVLAEQLINSEETTVIAQGHTDNTGSAGYNKGLSERRAQAVMDYLVEKGVPAERISIEGYGFDNPASSNDTEEGRAKNRRVEFK